MDCPCPGERGTNGVEAELSVDVLANRVVDAGDHPGDFEDLAGDLGRHAVSIVAVGPGGETIRAPDPGLAEDIPIDPVAEDHRSVQIGAQPAEGATMHTDNGPLVPRL